MATASVTRGRVAFLLKGVLVESANVARDRPAYQALDPVPALNYSGIPGIYCNCPAGQQRWAHGCCSPQPGNDNDGPALL